MKQSLRKYYLNYRLNADPNYLYKQALDISSNLFKFITQNYNNMKIIAVYYPINNEVNLIDIFNKLLKEAYKLVLPSIKNDYNFLKFYEVNNFNKLIKGKYDIGESPSDNEFIPDIIIIPVVACDKLGNRLGYGAGYYDKTLNELKKNHDVQVIAPCYDFQISDNIPSEEHDQKLDVIITSKNIFHI